MSERAETTQDFMNVDSFSQLPFIRPSSVAGREKPTSPTSSGIRLFGFEVPQETTATTNIEETKESPTNSTAKETVAVAAAVENSRKFECHYCCRNFPTSQALGGHQNAHKRERQHAKRAHIQSAMAAAHHQHHAVDRSIYGLINYTQRIDSMPSWLVAGNGCTPRVYNTGIGSVAQPINGSPLPAIWRVPGDVHGGFEARLVRQEHHHQGRVVPLQLPLQLLQGEEQRGGGYLSPLSSSSSNSRNLQNQMVCETTAGLKENVSLDLHL